MITKSQVKYIQSLGQKKVRDREQVFLAEGPKIINELLTASSIKPLALYAVKEWQQFAYTDSNEGLPLTIVTQSELERISFLSTPNQVLGVFKKATAPEIVDFSSGISLMLDDIQDPGNMGTIIRIADWFGISRIICSISTADAYAPKVVQSTMGSIARVPVFYAALDKFINEHPYVKLYVASLQGKPVQELYKINQGIIVIGNESKGVSAAIMQRAYQQITIARKGNAESLNASVAAGIILSHLVE
jgi:RNA methyltransferase, TrmH family